MRNQGGQNGLILGFVIGNVLRSVHVSVIPQMEITSAIITFMENIYKLNKRNAL